MSSTRAQAALAAFAALLAAAAIGLGGPAERPRDVTQAATDGGSPETAAIPHEGHGARRVFPGPYEARLVSVVDGDTFRARLSVWFGQEVETLVRLRRVDAPELSARCPSEAERAAAARRALAEMLGSGRIVLTQVGGDKYFGRVVADVAVASPEGAFPPVDVGETLAASGLARAYDGRARAGWCDLASR